MAVDFELCPDSSTNFTIYGRMIPLFVVLLFALVVISAAVFRPNPPARGVGRSIESILTVHRIAFEFGSSASADELRFAPALFRAQCNPVDSRRVSQFRTQAFL